MGWSDFTNKVLGVLGMFVLIPLIIAGAILCLFGNVGIGILVIFGSCILYLAAALVLVLFKPLLLKKYPEKRYSVPVNKDIPIEERRKQPLRSTGKYIVDQSVPYESLSLIQKLAVDKFGGDVELAFDYLFLSTDHRTQEKYTENLTKWEAQAGVQCLNSGISQKLTKREIQEIVGLENMLAHLHMSREQVYSAEKNPFICGMWRWSCALLMSCIVVGILVGLGNRFLEDAGVIRAVAVVLGCGSTFLVYKVVNMIINCVRFRKAKRIVSKDDMKEDNT